jgi:hypothetical protein
MSVDIPVLGRVTWQGIALGVVLGIVFAPQIRRIPGINKLPSA